MNWFLIPFLIFSTAFLCPPFAFSTTRMIFISLTIQGEAQLPTLLSPPEKTKETNDPSFTNQHYNRIPFNYKL